jgi:glycerol kinase
MRTRDRLFKPKMKEPERARLYTGWQSAVERVRLKPQAPE